MAAPIFEIDPTSEDAANAATTITANASGYYLLEFAFPLPPLNPIYAGSVDTEGDPFVHLKYLNRRVSVKIRVEGTSDANLASRLSTLTKAIGKLNREGGTLKFTAPDSSVFVFDVLPEVTGGVSFGQRYVKRQLVEVDFEFTCKPFARGTAVTAADNTETTLPCIVFTVASVAGDVPALGKLVVDEDQATDQWFVQWGLQSRYYTADASAALFWQAESLTALGTAAAAVGPTGASGAGSNTILQNALTTTYAGVLSTQATGGGAHMSHIGDFRVWARVQTPTANTGAVKVRLDWAEGDFRKHTLNDEVELYPDSTNIGAWEGTWRHVDLGTVHLTKVAQGTQRWEGRVLAKSTVAGDDIYVDCLYLFPVTEGYGEVRAVQQFENVTAFSARDEFDQTAGALAGKTAPVGGVWAGAGDADDFQVSGSGVATRAVASDASTFVGRIDTLDLNLTNTLVQVDFKSTDTTSARQGVIARYVDANNFLAAVWTGDSLQVYKYIAAAATSLHTAAFGVDAGTYYTVRLVVSASGRWTLWGYRTGADSGVSLASGGDSALATAGTLATGDAGIIDSNITANTPTRTYNNFFAAVPTPDAAMFASQSAEWRHDRVIREDSGGTLWLTPSKYEGDYLLVPPAGRESRTARFIVKASRNDPDSGPDSSIDDISARLTYTPRYLVVPY